METVVNTNPVVLVVFLVVVAVVGVVLFLVHKRKVKIEKLEGFADKAADAINKAKDRL